MYIKKSIECWLVDCQKQEALLLRVPAKKGNLAFNQPVTGGIEGAETPEQACIREVFEETGFRLQQNNLHCLRRNFRVSVDDTFELDKHVFLYETPVFEVTLSPSEHENYQWASFADIADLLTYPSNQRTWVWAEEFLNLRTNS